MSRRQRSVKSDYVSSLNSQNTSDDFLLISSFISFNNKYAFQAVQFSIITHFK